MSEAPNVQVLIVAAPSQRGSVQRLTRLLTNLRVVVEKWPADEENDEDGKSEAAPLTLADAADHAAIVVLLADQGFASGRLGERAEIHDALSKVADRLLIVPMDQAGRSSLSLRSMDVLPTRGSVADLDEGGRSRLLESVALEVANEFTPLEPQPAELFDEYKLMFESTDRLVQRRRETTQVFFGVNAALSAVIAFLVKDLALSGPRLSVVTVPLFLMGMAASLLWRRTIEQYVTLIDWRYRQMRRLERRGFVSSYRLFNREWEAIYAPKPPGAFGFSGLESLVPRVFFVLHLLGVAFAIAMWFGWLGRLGL
jgi:hypothetical protein